ncbi:MAG: STAS domain-containing protein [Oscillospiraceae bacterium]|jgi:stage II sporulation protein AA (anti-sigma F factor antagonist)|nr:STAS domain-containing protein [Oscillospiraceae bacterium]
MKVSYRQEGRTLTVALQGELDHHAAQGVLRGIEAAVDTRLPLRCVLDMGGVDFMDSSGLAIVLGTYRRLRELGGSLALARVPNQARRVLSAAHLDRFVSIEGGGT